MADIVPDWSMDDDMLWKMLNDVNPSPSTESSGISDWSLNSDLRTTPSTDSSIMSDWLMNLDNTWHLSSELATALRGPAGKQRRSSSSTDSEVIRKASILSKIDRKADELASKGIDDRDIDKLRTRLAFLWDEDNKPPGKRVTAVTTWRASSARRAYALIQASNPHLLLPVVLAVPPTECSTPTFKDVLPELLQNPRYLFYQLSSSPRTMNVLQSLAVESDCETVASYTEFLNSIFPQGEQSDSETLREALDTVSRTTSRANAVTAPGSQSYSSLSTEDLPAFLQSLMSSVYGSDQAMNETLEGVQTTNCATVFVPTNSNDCVCRLVISREAAVEAITKYGLLRRNID